MATIGRFQHRKRRAAEYALARVRRHHRGRVAAASGCRSGSRSRDRGLHVALYDVRPDAVDAVNAGEMPFVEPGAPEVARRRARGRRLLERHPRPRRGRRRPSTSSSSSAPRSTSTSTPTWARSTGAIEEIAGNLPDGQLLVLRSTVYPGVTAVVERLVARLGARRRRRLLPRAHRRGQGARGARRAAADRRAALTACARARRQALPQPHPRGGLPRARGSGAGQALHQRLALHQVRGRQPALHDGERLRPRLRAHPRRR